jgi:arylamine N-acetyltransferase
MTGAEKRVPRGWQQRYLGARLRWRLSALKEAFMGIKVDRRNFLVAVGAGAAAMSLSELRPGFAQPAAQSPKDVKPELANQRKQSQSLFGTIDRYRIA